MPERPSAVLLVEDNPGDAELIAELIHGSPGSPLRVIHATRLSVARELLRSEPIDVVLLDLSLPDAHGLATIHHMREAAPALPVVVLTSLADQATALAAVHAGAQDYLIKGEDDGRVLRRALRYAMERQVLERERAELLQMEHAARLVAEEERARAEAARRAAEETERRASLLAAAGRELLSALDPATTLATLATLVVPTLASRAATFLVTDKGGLAPVAVAGGPPPGGAPDPLSVEAVAALLAAADPRRASSDQPPLPMAGEPLVLPLRARGRLVGALVATCLEGATWCEADLGLLRDLADRAALGVDNGQSFDAACRAVGARDQVLGVVSHDLRNPISAIVMCAESLSTAPAPDPDELLRIAGFIRESARWMQRIIRDLLDVSAIDAGRLAVTLLPTAPEMVLARLVVLHEPVAQERNIELDTPLPAAGSLPRIQADADRLVQALGNLLSNAIKFSARGSTVHVELELAGGELGFHIRDHGPGIAPEHLALIFDRFWQVRETREGGAGLGLAIARGIAEAHGGRVTVESVRGEGSTFSLWLPTVACQE